MFDFTVRIYQDTTNAPVLSYLTDITISDITLISKDSKFTICNHNGNKRKYKYDYKLSKPFNKTSGSHSLPNLSFKGDYLDITVFNFPRFPAFYQSRSSVISCLSGYGYTNYLNNGFPHQLLYRTVEILDIKQSCRKEIAD